MKKWYLWIILLCFIMEFSSVKLSAQNQLRVKGKITTKDGALPGASVAIKGTTVGTTTDINGDFTLDVEDANAVLVVSFIGYLPEELPLNGKTQLESIVLVEDISTLAEVVVVGYGTQSKKNLITSVVNIKPDDLNRGAITDVGQLLQGKVPGLNITSSGDPNARAAVILRGASTVNSSQGPLYVIDGIVGADISIVAPDDIATVDVLKDGAATAIYGNRGSNGVIMITTKRGKKGQTQVTYSSYVGIEKVSNKLKMMSADQLRAYLDQYSLALSSNDDKGANTDWQSEVEKKQALSQNHNVSFNGGTENNTYSASVNYAYKDGILPKSALNRFIARLAMDQYAMNNKLKFGVNLNYSNNNATNTPLRNTVLQQMIERLPVSPVKNADGTYHENLTTGSYFNPLAIINNAKDETKYSTFVGAFSTHAELPFGFSYDVNISYQKETSLHGEAYGSYFSKVYGGTTFYNNPDPPLVKTILNFGTNGSALRNYYETTKKIIESYFTWEKDFADHNFKAVLGYSYQNTEAGDGFQATTTNLAIDDIGYSNLGLSNPYAVASYRINLGADNYSKVLLISDYFRLNYSFRDKYLLQGSVRRDGSSVFGSSKKFGYFPSVGVAWRVIEESFLKAQSIVSDLKVRASYGVTGNSSGFNAYTAQNIIGGVGSFYYNGVTVAAYGPFQAANPNLQWEKTTTSNIGLDFAILNNKVSGSVDWYDKKTTDMIFPYTVAPNLVPVGLVVSNGGEIDNTGIELSLNATPIASESFTWTTGVNIASNTNKIISLSNANFTTSSDSTRYTQPDGGSQTSGQLQIRKVGKPVGQFFTLIYAGKDDQGNSQFIDKNGDLTISPTNADANYAGSPQPKMLLGWTNTLTYKNFTLNFFLRGVFGNKIFNATRADLFRPGTAQYTNILQDVATESRNDAFAFKYSSRFIEDGTYVRMDNATLGYNFKLTNPYIKTLRVYTSVNNAFVITKYKGIDPEINQGGMALGVDSNNFYPKTRTFLFGVNVSF